MNLNDFDWIEQTRMRSIRRRRRSARTSKDKELLRKHKEEKALYKDKKELGWEELKPPVQRGFIRFFVLRFDVARSRDATFYRNILDKINTKHWSSRSDFKQKRRRFGKKVYAVSEQKLADIHERDFFKKFDAKERLHFFDVKIHRSKREIVTVYRFNEPWRFVLTIQPNMITKTRVKDFDLERRMKEVDRFFNTDKRSRLKRLLHGTNFNSHYLGTWKDPRTNPLKNPRDIEGFLLPDWTSQKSRMDFLRKHIENWISQLCITNDKFCKVFFCSGGTTIVVPPLIFSLRIFDS